MRTPKHLLKIEGERILDRTVRLLTDNSIKDVYVVTKDNDARYKTQLSNLYIANLDYENNADADKFLSSKDLWNKSGRTIVIYGDCYFSNRAIHTIASWPHDEWTLFCRPHGSSITGSKYGECFAQSFYPFHISEHEACLHKVAALYKNGTIKRCGGWEHYRAMIGVDPEDLNTHVMGGRHVEINDWTEDFDYPDDYVMWTRRRLIYKIKESGSLALMPLIPAIKAEEASRISILKALRLIKSLQRFTTQSNIAKRT